MLGKTCFRDIGCFSALDFHDFFERPISVLPMTPEYINPDYYLYTKKDTVNAVIMKYNVNVSELRQTSFNPKFRTIVVVHGFRSALEPWMVVCIDLLSWIHYEIM